jgi:protein involved in polysaccharide export with SLBB domain
LQAIDVVATGLTVDELRAKLEGILGKFHVAPRVIIVPQSFHSKKYFVLGNVTQRGVFTLDRPTTIVEAVAKARGFTAAGPQRSSFNLADLSHAFLMRRQPGGEFVREPVDFEGLFQRGELQHNKLLAPDDYLYFPPLGLDEVYVLGEVRSIGVTPYVKNLSALGAIASRGGFTEGAFRQKILIVRGSLEKPETFVVDLQSTLRAQSPDFALQPRDIVYVSRKPWAKAQELLEAASSDFVRAVAVSWTGRKISPAIQ